MANQIALDIDGTLLDYNYIPGAQARTNDALIAEIAKLTSRVALVTNQGGIAFGLTKETFVLLPNQDVGRKYPKPNDFNIRLRFLHAELRRAEIEIVGVYVSLYHPKADPFMIESVKDDLMQILPLATRPVIYIDAESRKPSPKMLIDSGATIYYGDSDEDAQAASAAEIEFVKVDRFFG